MDSFKTIRFLLWARTARCPNKYCIRTKQPLINGSKPVKAANTALDKLVLAHSYGELSLHTCSSTGEAGGKGQSTAVNM